MNLDQLKTFCTAVECKNFSKASEKLYCSQPSVSKQIHSLEKELGYPLFKREGTKLSLNENGKIVYKYSQKILKEVINMKFELTEQNNSSNSTISFAATNFIGVHMITSKLNDFKNSFPNISLTYTIDFASNVLKFLDNNKVSFAFIPEFDLISNYPNIKINFFKEDELILVVPNNHKWANKKSINIFLLTSELFLLSHPNSAMHNFIEKQLNACDIHLKNKINLYNIEGIKQSLLKGIGISILPRKSVITELKHNLLIEVTIENINLTRKLFIAYKEDKKFNQNEINFIKSLK